MNIDDIKIPEDILNYFKENITFNVLEAPERMHCFLLFYIDNRVYQLEHPDFERIGIYEY